MATKQSEVRTPDQSLPTEYPRAHRPHMSIRESSEYLGLSPDSIGRLVKSGTIPASRLGERVVRIKREDLDRFVSDNRIETNRSKWRR